MGVSLRLRTGIAILLAALIALASAASGQIYKVIGQYKLPGSSARAIAIDSGSRRLFVAGNQGIAILNADTGAALGFVGGIKNAQDVLLIPEMNGEQPVASSKGYASDGEGHVVAFSLEDLRANATIKLEAPGPSSLCYDSQAKTVEVVSRAGWLTTIDPADGKVIAARKAASGQGQVVCGDLGDVYVADPADNVVHVLNHDTVKGDGDFPMKSGHKPTGLALDTEGRRLFVSCDDGTTEIIDTDAGFTFIELKGGTGVAHGTFVWLPQGNGEWKAAAFMAQEDGTLSGIRMNAFINYTMGGQYKLVPGLGPVAYDKDTHHLFFAAMVSGTPTVVVAGY